jgi:hypothetical protein
MYITRLASKEIFSPSNKIHREVARAKDLSAPLHASKEVDRDRVIIWLFIVTSGVPIFMSTKVDSSRKKSSGILLCNGGSRVFV